MTKHSVYAWTYLAVAMLAAPEADEEPIDLPGLDDVRLSHRGSMWSGGMAFCL